MAEIELLASVPVLNVADVTKSFDFYRERLGFGQDFAMPGYGGVSRDGMALHLNAGETEFSARPTCCRFHIRGVDALYAELEPKGVVKPDERLATMPHGLRQFSVLDLDGNRITFAEPVA